MKEIAPTTFTLGSCKSPSPAMKRPRFTPQGLIDTLNLIALVIMYPILIVMYLCTPGRDPSEDAAAWDNGAP